MATPLFTLAAVLTLETAKFTRGIRNAANEGKNFASSLQSKLSAGTVAMGNLISSTVKATATGLKNLTNQALQVTGDVEQALGGSEAVFGKWAGDIQEKAKTAFREAGLSAGEYLDTANRMGSLLQGSGFTTVESFDMSAKAMQRAADVASIMGLDIGSAMESVAGMAKGNFTMMDNLGVAINDTTLKMYAMEKGIKKNVSQMSTAEKVGLAYEMFMERTAQYAGNYAKENETLNGSIQTLKSSFENLLSGQGTVDDFVTSAENAARVTMTNLGEILPRLGGALVEGVQTYLPKLGESVANWWDTDAENIATSGANTFIQGVNAVFGTNIPKVEKIELPTSEQIKETVSAWWSGEKSVIESLCNWTLNMFGLPDVKESVKQIQEWWNKVWDKGGALGAGASNVITDMNPGNPTTPLVNMEVQPEVPAYTRKTLQETLSSWGLTVNVTPKLTNFTTGALNTLNRVLGGGGGGVATLQKYATGLNYVPYNDMPALLHAGEAVLTRTEAEEWRRGGGQSVVSIDYDKIAQAVATALGGVQVSMDGRAVGALVAPTVSKAINQSAKTRRHTG